MAQSRDIGSLGQVSITPANFVPETQFSGPADQSATQALIAGLGNLSDGVARLGMAYASEQRRHQEDPEAKRLAYARASMELVAAGGDPDAGAKLYAATDPNDKLKRDASGAAVAGAFLDKVKAEWLTKASEAGVENVDWNKEAADAIKIGKAKGYIPDDNAAATFLANANQLFDTFRTQGVTQANNNAEFKRIEKLRVSTANDFVSSLTKGPEAAQGVLDKLFSSKEYQALTPVQQQQLMENTIQGMVTSGDVRGFTALSGVDGPDGVNLKTKYAERWEVWQKQVEDNAKAVHSKDYLAGVMASQPHYAENLEKLQGLSGEAKAYGTAVALRRNTALSLAKDTIDQAVADQAAGKPVDIDQLKQEALQRAQDDGVFSGEGDKEAMQVFSEYFDANAQQFRAAKQDEQNKAARAKADLDTSKALQISFETALTKAGPDAAVAAIQHDMATNQIFLNRSGPEQGQMLSGMAQTFARQGNVKALEAIGKVMVSGQGHTVQDIMQSDWPVLQAQAAQNKYEQRKAEIEPLKVKIRTAAATGNYSPELEQEALQAGVPTDFLAEQSTKNDSVIAKKTTEVNRHKETLAKSQFLDKNAALAGKAIRSGRADLLVGTSLNYDQNDPTKVLNVSREDQIAAGMKEAEQDFTAEYDAAHPNADPQKRKMDIRHEVMRMHSRNGLVDDNTKETFKAFLQKSQRDGFSLGQEDIAQLSDMRDAMAIYSAPALDDLVGADGRKRDFFDAMMAKLNETGDAPTAIAYARTVRDAPDDQRVQVPEKKLNDLTDAAVQQLDAESDPYINGVLRKVIKRQISLGATDDYAQSVALKEIATRYTQVNGRHVNMKELDAKATPELVSEILNDAVAKYTEAHADSLHGAEIAFDNGPRPGTLQVYFKDTGLPVSSKLVNWSDIYNDYDKRVLQKRRAEEDAARQQREADLMARARDYGSDAASREKARLKAGEQNADKLLMPPRLRD